MPSADWLISTSHDTFCPPVSMVKDAMESVCTKEGVESLCILPYTSVNVCIVNGQWLKFNAVNGQSPENQRQNAEKSWSKFWE